MRIQPRAVAGAIATLCVSLGAAAAASSQAHSTVPGAGRKEAVVTSHASGTFDVKLTPQLTADKGDPPLGRMAVDKQYHGDLAGTGKGEMLGAGDPAKGSAGYVAMERVSGTLQGRSGTFVLQHSGTMHGGATQLSVTVVPGTGTGQLAGIAGSMSIKIENGQHFYELQYTLAD